MADNTVNQIARQLYAMGMKSKNGGEAPFKHTEPTKFPVEKRLDPGRTPRLNYGNVYVGSEAPQYRKILDKANSANVDPREYRYDEERGGIWVSQKWIWS